MEKDLNISSLIDVYGNFLSKKQKELCIYYFFDDLSLGEIAENEGITSLEKMFEIIESL